MIKRSYKITSVEGLHARPAATLVAAVTPFTSEVKLEYQERQVNMKSIMGLMSLGISKDSTIKIIADGSDEEDLMAVVDALMKTEGLATG